jgi:hypothetical protein
MKFNTPHHDTDQEQNDTRIDSQPLALLYTSSISTGDTSSDQTLETLSDWIEDCVEHHDSCQQLHLSELPKRILEIEGISVYLREHVITRVKYACLSHCWGSIGPALKLTKTSLPRLEGGLLIEHLPKSFWETVLLCARLGLRFIWIDALCKFLSTGCSGIPHLSSVPRYQARRRRGLERSRCNGG